MTGLRQVLLVARGVWLEAIRRRELYVIVAVCCAMIGGLAQVQFFGLESLSKFYREIALKLMGVSTALAVVVLAARQLPREFESRTIYPLLARPVRRSTFVLGKLLGVLGAGGFCLGLFMLIYVLGSLSMGAPLHGALLVQYVVLQLTLLLVLASLCFAVSILFNLDAAITFGILFYIASSTFATMMTYLYHTATVPARVLMQAFTWILPQFMLFDLSEKAVHGDVWQALPSGVILQLVAYGLAYVTLYLGVTLLLFRRKAL